MPAEQSVAPTEGCVQVPRLPAPIVQMPPQHSESCAHASPFWTQNEDAPHVPLLLQNAEQQLAAVVHGFPSVLHDVLSGVHVPPVPHLSPQHCASLVHAASSARHCVAEHTLPMQ